MSPRERADRGEANERSWNRYARGYLLAIPIIIVGAIAEAVTGSEWAFVAVAIASVFGWFVWSLLRG